MEMVIRKVPQTVDIMLARDENRGDIDILVNGVVVAYFSRGVNEPVLRIRNKELKSVGFSGHEVW